MKMMFSCPLDGDAELGLLEPWYAEEFLAAVDESREHLKASAPAALNVLTVEDARTYLQRFADGHANDTERQFGIWLDGALVGVIQLFAFKTKTGNCEMGAWIADKAEGRGLVTTSCRMVLDWAFVVRGMKRVQWTNNPDNVRSSAVAKRLGMTKEGLLRSYSTLGGVRWDNEVWSVLAEEWPTKVWTP